jgi:hypothetical protein
LKGKTDLKERKNKKVRKSDKGINKFKRSCQQRTNLETNKKGDLLACRTVRGTGER